MNRSEASEEGSRPVVEQVIVSENQPTGQGSLLH